MTATLVHRGPDDGDVFLSGPVALGHRRLSILDLQTRARQPMQSADGRYTLVYNGEVYNFKQLRLGLAPHVQFRTTSDTEVVLEAYARWGVEAFVKFNGMFAMAIWDDHEQSLTLARDRFGIKPLYVMAADGDRALVFGSELKALAASGLSPTAIDTAALHEYLHFGVTHGARTMVTGMRKLAAGTWMRVTARARQTRRFWDVGAVAARDDPVDTAVGGVRTRLELAVERHLVADVPVAVFLSGGIDSSAITAFAARSLGDRLRTYSVGFDFDQVNELPVARRVARRFGTDHHELHLCADSVPKVLQALADAHDQPFGDAANIPLFLLCKQLRGEVKVVLQGDGGDEIFAGYRRYNVLAHAAFWRLVGRAHPLLRLASDRHPLIRRAWRFLAAAGELDDGQRMALLLTEEPTGSDPARMLRPELAREVKLHDPFARYRELNEKLRHLHPVQRMLHTDCSVQLPDQYLEKVDRATMTHGIEVRVPFLDTELTDYALGLPWTLKVRGLQKKWLLRRALRGIVPDEVLDRKKTGFGVPYGLWLKGPLSPWAREVLLDEAISSDGLLDERETVAVLGAHIAGRSNQGYLLYKTLMLALWRQRQASQPKRF